MSGWRCINGYWKDGAGVSVRVAPVQVRGHEGTVPWEVSAEAWKEYAAQGHGSQSHDRICERGGWGAAEMAILLFERIKRLEAASPGSSPPPPPAAPEDGKGADARGMPAGTLVTCEHCPTPHPKDDDGRPCCFPKVASPVSGTEAPRCDGRGGRVLFDPTPCDLPQGHGGPHWTRLGAELPTSASPVSGGTPGTHLVDGEERCDACGMPEFVCRCEPSPWERAEQTQTTPVSGGTDAAPRLRRCDGCGGETAHQPDTASGIILCGGCGSQMSPEEANRILFDAGIDPEAAYERLRAMVKERHGIDLPPRPSPSSGKDAHEG